MQPIRILQHNPVAEGSEVFQQVIGLTSRQPLARLITGHDRHRHCVDGARRLNISSRIADDNGISPGDFASNSARSPAPAPDASSRRARPIRDRKRR